MTYRSSRATTLGGMRSGSGGRAWWIVIALAVVACARSVDVRLPRIADASGCVVETVAAASDEDHFSFRGLAPDDRSIAIGFSGGRDSTRGTYVLDLRTGQRIDLPELNNGGSFSPDGRFIVAAVNRGTRRWDIVELERRTHATREIAPDSAADFLPSYSPDGRFIVFNSYRTGRSDLYRYERRNSELERLTTFDGYDAHAQIAPDARSIVFHREVKPGDYNLVLLDLQTMRERFLTSSPGEESYPAFSPHGEYIVYSDDRQHPGATDLFVYSLGSGESVPLTSGGGRDGYATWSHDGLYIYFTSHRAGHIGVYRVRMNGFVCQRADRAD